jgi:surface polysaccharide O-acyltransferase-like enzyme
VYHLLLIYLVLTLVSPKQSHHVMSMYLYKLMIVFIASENDELKRENKMLKIELSRLKGKCHVQPSQDNRDHMVKKVEKGSTVTCVKLP